MGTDSHKKPFTTVVDALTNETTTREMTDDEYAALLATGWTEQGEPEE